MKHEDRDSGHTRRWVEAGGHIGYLLLPKFSMMELFCSVDSLRIANRLGQCGYDWRFFSLDGRSVQASNSVSLDVTQRFGDSATPPILFVVASFEPEAAMNQAANAILRRMGRQGVLLGSLDTGAFVLARAGLLNKRRVTLHWESIAAFAEEFPHIEVTPNLFELCLDRMTCSGGSAAIDMTLHLIALQHGQNLARSVGEQIIHPTMRSGKDAQRLAPQLRYRLGNPDVAASIDLMEAHLQQPLPVAAIAKQAGLSQRQLERLYQHEFGRTVKSFYVALRLERARQLLVDSRSSVNEAALGTGFETVAHFSRTYRRAFGHPPRSARAEAAAPSTLRNHRAVD